MQSQYNGYSITCQRIFTDLFDVNLYQSYDLGMKHDDAYELLTAFDLPSWNEIPDVGLYLDQVTKYINGYLADYDLGVTPSMISNYVKLKIISREGKKIYGRERIAALFFVAVSKTILSMDQIRECLLMQEAVCSVEQGYTSFKRELKEHLQNYERGNRKSAADEDDAKEMLRKVTAAIAYKMYLDTYFRNAHVPAGTE